jgi:3-hydroxyacyl-CoA dehydrogenase
MNGDRLLADAKATALAAIRDGYQSPLRSPIRVVGERGVSALEAGLYLMKTAGQISDYDQFVGQQLAYVVCGGRVPYGTSVSE